MASARPAPAPATASACPASPLPAPTPPRHVQRRPPPRRPPNHVQRPSRHVQRPPRHGQCPPRASTRHSQRMPETRRRPAHSQRPPRPASVTYSRDEFAKDDFGQKKSDLASLAETSFKHKTDLFHKGSAKTLVTFVQDPAAEAEWGRSRWSRGPPTGPAIIALHANTSSRHGGSSTILTGCGLAWKN